MLPADSAGNRLIGIGLVSLTDVLFSLLDGSAKWLVGSVPVIVVVWLRFATHVLFAVCLLGVCGGLGHYLLALAHRYAPATVLAPFLYQQVVYMALFGYLVFGR